MAITVDIYQLYKQKHAVILQEIRSQIFYYKKYRYNDLQLYVYIKCLNVHVQKLYDNRI